MLAGAQSVSQECGDRFGARRVGIEELADVLRQRYGYPPGSSEYLATGPAIQYPSFGAKCDYRRHG